MEWIEVQAKSLDEAVELALDRLTEAGVETVVVNTHWRADQVEGHLAARTHPRIIARREASLLDTGGSVKAANARQLFAMPNVDGGLVGGASLEPDAFAQIVVAAVALTA